MLRPATQADLADMNAMILAAKAHWGYDAAFMRDVRQELCVPAAALGPDLVIWDQGGPAGMAQVSVEGAVAHLEMLFVSPAAMGQGLGRRLFDWAVARCRTAGHAQVMRIDSDPFAEAFYRKMGAQRVGETPSGSIAGRMLPLMDYTLDPRANPSQT